MTVGRVDARNDGRHWQVLPNFRATLTSIDEGRLLLSTIDNRQRRKLLPEVHDFQYVDFSAEILFIA